MKAEIKKFFPGIFLISVKFCYVFFFNLNKIWNENLIW